MRPSLIACLLAAGITILAFPDDQGTIAGQVVSRVTGAPLNDAIVTLRYADSSSPDQTLIRQTNESGRFSFTSLWGREWELSVECKGFAPAIYGATRYDPRGRFKLEKNQQIKDVILKLIPQAVITGKVLDAERKPVEGARVTLVKASYTAGILQWTDVASAQTLDNGEYRLPRIAPGRYAVKCTIPRAEIERMPSESAVETGYVATYYPNVTDPALASPVNVTDGQEIRDVDLQLARTRVFHLRGRLQSPVEWRTTGVITLVDREDSAKTVASLTARPPDYIFDLDHIPPGRYLAHGKLNATPIYQAVQAVDIVDRDLDGLFLKLARADALSGVLRPKPDDRPVDLRGISLRVPLNQVGTNVGTTWPLIQLGKDLTFRVPVDQQAFSGFRVEVSGLPDGWYVASIRYGAAEVPKSGIEYSPCTSLVVTIGIDGGRIDGAATGADDQPVGRAVVGLFPTDGKGEPRSLQADAQGAFHFVGVPPGDYKLIAWDDVSRDDLGNPEFVRRFDNKAKTISITANSSAAASLKVVSD